MTSRDIYKLCEDADKDTRAGPHAWIQWKGTDVCMDVHCECGFHSHVDADFCYRLQCPECKSYWAMCCNVRMVRISEEEALAEYGCDMVAGT